MALGLPYLGAQEVLLLEVCWSDLRGVGASAKPPGASLVFSMSSCPQSWAIIFPLDLTRIVSQTQSKRWKSLCDSNKDGHQTPHASVQSNPTAFAAYLSFP